MLRLLSQMETAELCRLSPRTMERLRTSGGGPPYTKLGRRVFYRPEDVEGWITSRVRNSTSEAVEARQ